MAEAQQVKEVNADWREVLKPLTYYKSNKFYKVLGPTILGIELLRLPGGFEYRPVFVVYGLWGDDLAGCLVAPILIFQDYKNGKGFQLDILFTKHSSMFESATLIVIEQSPLPFVGDIKLTVMQSLLDYHAENSELRASSTSYLQARLQESKLKMALYVSTEAARDILAQIKQRTWNEEHFNYFGKDVATWLKSLEDLIEDRDGFIEHVERLKSDNKLKKLVFSELIPEDDVVPTNLTPLDEPSQNLWRTLIGKLFG